MSKIMRFWLISVSFELDISLAKCQLGEKVLNGLYMGVGGEGGVKSLIRSVRGTTRTRR